MKIKLILLGCMVLGITIVISGCLSSLAEERTKESTVYSDMVFIPAGDFFMGSTEGDLDEKPVHSVYLDAYYIDKYEVTNGQFCKFLNEKGNQEEGGEKWLGIEDSNCSIEYQKEKYYPKPGYEDYPVVEVSWYGAYAYAKWAGKRLPTEAEWEKAARGSLVDKKYPWGDIIDSSKANYGENVGYITPVGFYPPNDYGLYDMAGNVWEWCFDWYNENYYEKSPTKNPQGPDNATYRVRRGGCWRNLTRGVRCAHRFCHTPLATTSALGFRCAKSIQ